MAPALPRWLKLATQTLVWAALWVLAATAAHAKPVRLAIDAVCQPEALANGNAIPSLGWEGIPTKILQVPTGQVCWVRLHRTAPATVSQRPDNQFLLVENSWGSDFNFFSADGQLLARSTVAGERYRLVVDKAQMYVPLPSDYAPLLYARVTSLQHFSTVRHNFDQGDWGDVVERQQRSVMVVASAWLLFSAAVFSLLLFLFHRHRQYVLFSAFALIYALTLFSDRGEFTAFGLTASSDLLSLSYPLSGMILGWVALDVGRFRLHAPWVARAVLLVMGLYGSLVVWQLSYMLGLAVPVRHFETYSEWVYDAAALLQLMLLWGSFKGWRRGDRVSGYLILGLTPLVLFEIQISDWLAWLSPGMSSWLRNNVGSTLRVISYLLLPLMFFGAIALRSRQAQREAVRLAQRDQLTNLPNRDHFLRLGETVLAQGNEAVLLAISIDRLKVINDVLGFEVGDAVIVQVGERLSRIGHGTLARVQTNQFCLLLAHVTLLPSVERDFGITFRKPVTVRGETMDVALRVGLAHQQDGQHMGALLRNADVALGVAKATRSNWLTYDPAMNTTRPESLSLLSELDRAIENNEFELHLQPKVRLTDGRITGAEALLRWRHPQRGLVPPYDFIPFAEQTGKITALTTWVLRESARLAGSLKQRGLHLRISVNLSVADLREPLFVDRAVALVQSQGARPEDLRLEVTETGMMEDPQLSLTILHALHDAGFSLAVDDFGTGYSSLAYLQKMPVAELKVDRSFVRHVLPDTDGAALLDSIIAMGHRLGLSVVAEGGETAQECQVLQDMGCDYLQGWFVAKAMPFDEFSQWLKRNDPFAAAARDGAGSGTQ